MTKDITDFDRRTGTNLPDQEVTKDTDFAPKGKDGEIFMETRDSEANIKRVQKLAEENIKHEQDENKK